MNTRLIGVISILTAASAVASCEQASLRGYTEWDCFIVNVANPPTPHLEKDDEYCVVTRDGAWYLDPGKGMQNWKPIGGGSRIPLLITEDTATSKTWRFEVNITDHDTLPPSDHMGQHRAARGYTLNVIIPTNPGLPSEGTITVAGPPGDTIHNGSAHSVEN